MKFILDHIFIVAIVVLSTSALLFRSANALARVHPGFIPEGVSVFELMPA